MLKLSKMVTMLGGISLFTIAFWWIFYISAQPGFINLVQSIAYKFSPPSVSTDVVMPATQRALQYATDRSPAIQDIFFTRAELSHLLDVSAIFQPIRFTLGILTIFSFAWLFYVLSKYKSLSREMFTFARNLFFGLAILAVLALILFAPFFITFHEVLFPAGNWAFPDGSLLIEIFPEIFWKLMLGWYLLGFICTALIYHLTHETWYSIHS